MIKKAFAIAVTTIIIALSAIFNPIRAQSQRPDTKSLLDSLEVLKGVGGLFMGYSYPSTPQEKRYYDITKLLYSLSFHETEKLLTDSNALAKAYGFSVLVMIYFDSISTNWPIFRDTSKILIYSSEGLVDMGTTLGEVCEMAYASIKEDRALHPDESKVIAAIRNFIEKNAKFPESYDSKGFSEYKKSSIGEDVFYEMLHRYKLKQADGQDSDIEVGHYFVLDKNFKMVLIEEERSNIITSDTPITAAWLKKYGK